MFKYIRNESGQAMVFVALFLVVLMGFAALAVDVGAMTVQRSKLQNAADAAALAGADNMSDTVARSYAKKNVNSLQDSNIDVNIPYKGDPQKIEVTIEKTVKHGLASSLRFYESDITVRAVAEKISIDIDPLEYTLFSGHDIIFITGSGNETNIKGDIYGYAGITAKGTVIDGTASVSGDEKDKKVLEVKSATNTVGGKLETTPEFLPFIEENYTIRVTNKDQFLTVTNNGTHINDDIIFFDSTEKLIIDNPLSGKGIIFTKGQLECDGQISINDSIMFISNEGEKTPAIHFKGSGQNIAGFLVAPNGEVHFAGTEATLKGRIISYSEIKFSGGDADIDGTTVSEDVFDMLIGKIKLVE